MTQSSTPLNQALPAEIAAGSPRWWLAYRRYPVFSAPWVVRRALLFSLFIVAWGALSGLGHYAESQSMAEALRLFGWFLIGIGTVVNAGPVLAALVRHRGWTPERERFGVLAAMAAGLAVAFVADMVSSGQIADLIDQDLGRDFSTAATLVNVLVLFGIYLLLGGGLALRAYFSEADRLAAFRRRQELDRMQAEKLAADQQLALLQAQIEPHFLFNTLATIRSDLRRSPQHAEETLDALCAYLRTAIPRLREGEQAGESTLGEQLEVCRQYLKVMQGRMRQRLSFSIEAPESLQAARFPPFLLLSLVENAIHHGLEPKTGGGRIAIRVEQQAADGRPRLSVSVDDTGVGLGDAIGNGVGLSNIRQQLHLRHGERARLSLESRSGTGVRAEINLPLEFSQ
jgi:two-component sensor histidine kinase